MDEQGSLLIVDDNISLCKTLSFVLRRKGYAIITAKDGAEAIEKVKERSFDMIFMDIKMPHMNGVDTYKRIKEIRPEALVIMITAYAVDDLVKEALQEGAYGVLYKPLDIDKMVALIEKVKHAEPEALILVVDDDPGTCTILKNILARRGYKVGIAYTGEEAITMAQVNVYKLLFIDLKLPTINGVETYLTIKAHNPETVAIMMTGYRQEMVDLVKTALQNHAYACFYKPLDVPELLKVVDELREGTQQA
jgi:two-component system response regulator HydG